VDVASFRVAVREWLDTHDLTPPSAAHHGYSADPHPPHPGPTPHHSHPAAPHPPHPGPTPHHNDPGAPHPPHPGATQPDSHSADSRSLYPHQSLDEQVSQLGRVRAALYEAGWMRYGWPESVGGYGGPALLRAVLGEEVTARGLAEPGIYSMIEVLTPTMISYAPPALAAEMVPLLLSGQEQWCQGFSEPGSGSDLASLSTRAVPRGDDWVITGQKVWTSLAQHAQRCVLLTRTAPGLSSPGGTPPRTPRDLSDGPAARGTPPDPRAAVSDKQSSPGGTTPRTPPGLSDEKANVSDKHSGITAFFVDMDSPGITVRPLRTMHGVDEFAEVFFDDVVVPGSRMLGQPGDGWRLASDLLPYERSTCFWHRTAYLYSRLDRLVASAVAGTAVAGTAVAGTASSADEAAIGSAYLALHVARCRSRETQYRLAAAGTLGPETSVDKILLQSAEQQLYDTARDLLPGTVELEESSWRSEYLYSRAATIYGGTAEIQRNIIARRLLDLGKE
jgi:alkylation response protein AidB-like acyl-CoA dehydrogenase